MNSTLEAISIIEKNIQRYNIDCDYRKCSGIMYAQDNGECKDLNAIYKSLLELNIPVQKLSNPLPGQVMDAIRFDGQVHFHPTKYLAGLLDAYLQAGGLILEEVLVTQVKEDDGFGVEIITSDEKVFSADYAIYATHTPIGLNPLHLRIAPYRSYIQVWELDEEQFFPDHLVYDLKQPFHYFRKVLSGDKVCLMVGGEDHKTAHEVNE